MARIFLFLLALISFGAFAQFPISPNAYDSQGRRSGHWTILYDSSWKETTNKDSAFHYRLARFEAGRPVGKVRDFYRTGIKQWEGQLLSVNPDVQDGEVTYFHENGQPFQVYRAVNGKANGPFRSYSPTGVLLQDGTAKNDSLDGKWTYYNSDGIKVSELHKKNNLNHGPVVGFFPSGAVQSRGFKIRDLTEGLWEEFYEGGKIKSREHFLHGRYHGPAETYYENGQVEAKGQYLEDKKSGVWTTWFENGVKSSVGAYDSAGERTGLWRYYYANGNPQTVLWRKNGKLEGSYEEYYESGKLKVKSACARDLWQGAYEKYYESGQLEKKGQYLLDSLDGEWIYYYANGNLNAQGKLVNGAKHGTWKYYFEDGKLATEETNNMGKLEGIWVDYYHNGNVSERKVFVNGIQQGPYEDFYENGQRKTAGFKKEGKRHGDWTWYHPNGAVDSREHYEDGLWEGKWARYYSNGQLKSEGGALHDKEEGFKRTYYMDGKLSGEGMVRQARLEGNWVYYDSATRGIRSSGAYLNGKQHGRWKYPMAKEVIDRNTIYINGFEETMANIEDSLKILSDQGYKDRLRGMIDWLERVRRRDFRNDPYRKTEVDFWRAYAESDLGNHNRAIALLEDHLKVVKRMKGENSTQYISGLNNLAVELGQVKQHDKAYSLLRSLDQVYLRNPEETKNEITHHINVVYQLNAHKQLREQGKYLEEVLATRDTSKRAKPAHTLILLNALASFYLFDSINYVQSEKVLRKLLRVADSAHLTTDHNVGVAHYRLGLILRQRDQYLGAAAELAKAERLQYPQFARYPDEAIDTYNMLGNIYVAIQKYDSSEWVYTRLQKSLEQIGWTHTRKYTIPLDGLAELEYIRYNNKVALELWMQAKNLLEELKDTRSTEYRDVLQALSVVLPKVDESRWDEAEQYLLKAMDIDKSVRGENATYRSLMLSLAQVYTSRDKSDKAREVLERLLILNEKAGITNTRTHAEALVAFAKNEYNLTHYHVAVDYFNRGLAILERLRQDVPTTYLESLSSLGWCYMRLNELQKADEVMRKQLAESRALAGEEAITTITSLEDLGAVLRWQSLHSEAEKTYREALALTKKVLGTNNTRYTYTLNNLAMAYRDGGNDRKALEMFEAYANASIQVRGMSTDYADALDDMAVIYERIGNPRQAEANYLKALQIKAHLMGKNTDGYAGGLRSLGEFYSGQEQYAKAEKYLTEAADIILRNNGTESSVYANYLLPLADVKGRLDQLQKAEDLLLRATAIHQKHVNDRFGSYVNAVEKLQSFYLMFGRHQEALDYANMLLPMVASKWGIQARYIQNLLNKASIFNALKQYDSARVTARRALDLANDLYPPSDWRVLGAHNVSGLADLRQLKLDDAEAHFKYCIDQRKIIGEENTAAYSASLNNLGAVNLERGNYAEAERLLKAAGTIDEKLGNRELMNYVDLNLGKVYNATGQLDQAEKFFRMALNDRKSVLLRNFYFLSDNEKAQFWKDNRHFIEFYQSFAVQRFKQRPALLGELYNLQLTTKGILLNTSNKIKKRILTSGDSVMINQYYQWLHQRDALAQLYTLDKEELRQRKHTLDSLEASARAIEKDLNITSEDLEKDRGREATWRDVQRALGPDDAAVEIVRIRHHVGHATDSVVYVAMVLTAERKEGPVAVAMPDGKRMEGRGLRFYRNAILSQLQDSMSYQLYWSAIEPLVAGKRHLYLSLDGVYNSINLNTLRNGRGQYLADARRISTVANTRDVILLKKTGGLFSRTNATLMGFPKYFLGKEKIIKKVDPERGLDLAAISEEDRSGIATLPGTREEIQKIQTILQTKHWDVSTYLEESASEEAVKEIRHPGLLHIATHGYFTEDKDQSADPMLRAGLLFTGASNYLQDRLRMSADNGILTAYEAANLNLDNTELVILSACETGRGEIENGEGVYGLQRAFQTAGAKAILMSLWKVDDEATQELMTLFYQQWTAGKTKSEALAAAQLSLRQKYNHPYYWGAFVLMGE